MKIAVLGLGEAGSHFANDLADLGYEVSGWDPNPKRPLNEKVFFANSNAAAVTDVDIIFNVNLSEVASSVAEEIKSSVKSTAIFCEMNTSSPKGKTTIEKILKEYCHVLDVAIMAPVPPQGIRTPFLVTGEASNRFITALPELDNISTIKGGVGEAAKMKLLRSIVYKGIAAVICEAMEAAEYYGKEEYMREQIASIIGENTDLIDRFVEGSRIHAIRRGHEMEAVVSMLKQSELSAYMSHGSVENLKRYI
jgi:3-hydroxyisobutyrate dehydrogenase-like beta-hydroxyacid dehydrogenase